MAVDRKTKATERTEGRRGPSKSLSSLQSFRPVEDRFIPPHGGYEKLLSYQKALVVYDATVYFCDRFFNKRDRTRDQIIQAARSGKQNILEGSQPTGTSKETERQHLRRCRPSDGCGPFRRPAHCPPT